MLYSTFLHNNPIIRHILYIPTLYGNVLCCTLLHLNLSSNIYCAKANAVSSQSCAISELNHDISASFTKYILVFAGSPSQPKISCMVLQLSRHSEPLTPLTLYVRSWSPPWWPSLSPAPPSATDQPLTSTWTSTSAHWRIPSTISTLVRLLSAKKKDYCDIIL